MTGVGIELSQTKVWTAKNMFCPKRGLGDGDKYHVCEHSSLFCNIEKHKHLVTNNKWTARPYMVNINYYTVPGTSRYIAVKAQKTKPIDRAKARKQRKVVACDRKYKREPNVRSSEEGEWCRSK